VVWRETAGGASAAHDVCLCAPTGSGKTLAYCLPLLAALAGRSQPLLRALAVLPTRDLAAQVFGVLRTLCPALGLTAALAAGKASATAEAELLSGGGIGASACGEGLGRRALRLALPCMLGWLAGGWRGC
jgi:ATP-dependent RNA helicase DDX51/DBP6